MLSSSMRGVDIFTSKVVRIIFWHFLFLLGVNNFHFRNILPDALSDEGVQANGQYSEDGTVILPMASEPRLAFLPHSWQIEGLNPTFTT